MTDIRTGVTYLQTLVEDPPADVRVGATYMQALVLGSGPTASWWDGAAIQPAEILGWWDGSAIQPADDVTSWWDGTATQPLA